MLGGTGARSYYEEYVRRRGTNRMFQDPPTLLTDRGAYVNFLEVQLERVSAACLTVHSYEDKFNDIQTMITALEQRCAANTKLIALTQQCTEEVRSENNSKIDHLIHQMEQDKKLSERNYALLSHQIQTLDRTLHKLTKMDERMDIFEQLHQEKDTILQRISQEIHTIHQQEEKYKETLQTQQTITQETLQTIQHQLNKLSYDVDDHEIRLTTYRDTILEQTTQELDKQQANTNEKLLSIDQKTTNQLQQIQVMIQGDKIDTLQMIEKHYQTMNHDLQSVQSTINHDLTELTSNIQTTSQQQLQSLQQQFQIEIDSLQSIQQEQNEQYNTFEEEMIDHSMKLDRLTDHYYELDQRLLSFSSQLPTIHAQPMSYTQQYNEEHPNNSNYANNPESSMAKGPITPSKDGLMSYTTHPLDTSGMSISRLNSKSFDQTMISGGYPLKGAVKRSSSPQSIRGSQNVSHAQGYSDPLASHYPTSTTNNPPNKILYPISSGLPPQYTASYDPFDLPHLSSQHQQGLQQQYTQQQPSNVRPSAISELIHDLASKQQSSSVPSSPKHITTKGSSLPQSNSAPASRTSSPKKPIQDITQSIDQIGEFLQDHTKKSQKEKKRMDQFVKIYKEDRNEILKKLDHLYQSTIQANTQFSSSDEDNNNNNINIQTKGGKQPSSTSVKRKPSNQKSLQPKESDYLTSTCRGVSPTWKKRVDNGVWKYNNTALSHSKPLTTHVVAQRSVTPQDRSTSMSQSDIILPNNINTTANTSKGKTNHKSLKRDATTSVSTNHWSHSSKISASEVTSTTSTSYPTEIND